MFSSMFGGMYKGMENIGSEAVSAIQKVATPAAGLPGASEAADVAATASTAAAAPRSEPPAPRQIKYSTRPSASSPADVAVAGPSKDGAHMTRTLTSAHPARTWSHALRSTVTSRPHRQVQRAGRSAAYCAEWLLAHASAANLDGIRVLVPTSDCLTTTRGGGGAPMRKSRYRARGGARAAAADAQRTPERQHPVSQKRSFGDAGLAEQPGRETPDLSEGSAQLQDVQHDETGSPVSRWISPAGPSGHPAWDLLEVQNDDHTDVCDVLDRLVAAVAAHEEGQGAAAQLVRHGSLEGTSSFQFSSPAPAGEPDSDIEVWPLGGAALDGSPQRGCTLSQRCDLGVWRPVACLQATA